MQLNPPPAGEFIALAENSPDVIVRYDRHCRRVYVNPAYEHVNLLSSRDVLGRTPTEIASPATVAGKSALALEQCLKQVMASGEAAKIDLAWTNTEGQAVCFELSAVPELNAENEVVSVLTISRDVSQQRDALRQLSLLEFALDNVSEALYLFDEVGQLVHVNNGACHALGYSREELLQRCVFDFDPEFTQDRWDGHWRYMKTARTRLFRSRHQTKDGRDFPVEINAAQLEFDGRCYNLFLAQDISIRQRQETELHRCAQEFRALVDNSPDIIARYDRDCRRIYVNPAFVRQAGVGEEGLIGQRPTDFVQSADAREFEATVRVVFETGANAEMEYTWPAPDGRIVTSHFQLLPEFELDGKTRSVLAVGRDISALKESERRLEEAGAMAHLGHWQWDHLSRTYTLSTTVCRLFGQAPDWNPSPNEVIAMIVEEDRERVRNVYHDAYRRHETNVTFNYRVRHDGNIAHLQTQARIEYGPNGNPRCLIGATQDISELKGYESRLREVVFHDTLTGLPNRALLNDRLKQSLGEATRRNNILGLLVIDLDRFKEINDTHGHGIGDRVLTEVGKRLRELMRDYDTVARLGGDEFAIVLPDVRQPSDLGSISQKILDALACTISVGKQEMFVSASIGIAIFPNDAQSASHLLQYADSALNDAKSRGRAGYRFYASALTQKSRERTELETALRRAEPEGQLELYFQPKIDLAEGCLVGAEALIRWRHPSLGLVPPDKFIGIAEDTGLIAGMGAWVLTKACLVAQEWNRSRERECKIAINLSSRQFRDDDLVETVRSALSLTGCDPRWIELEITESLLLDDNGRVHEALMAFRNMGITIAIDDFGTGYSALGYLKRFPIDVLKIDRSFTRDVSIDRDSTELVKAIITMAHSLNLKLVAEGIETEVQEHFLRVHGCHLGQGYRYSRPVPKLEFEALQLMSQTPASIVAADE
jgi:diguanylate cyclase (GGDEF)-like protein/PAS domain S-box-containing protein